MADANTFHNYVLANGFRPDACPSCGNDSGFQAGYDDGRDPDYIGFQCARDGHVFGWDVTDAPPGVRKAYWAARHKAGR